MAELQALITHFTEYLALDAQETLLLSERITVRKLKRRQFILSEGETCKHYNFVVSGCLKMYKPDEAGKEHNLAFAAENDWLTDIGSFHSETASQLYIEAVEATTIIQIEKPDLLYFYTNYPKFDRNFRVILENQFIELQQRLLQTISTTAEERYENFVATHPHLVNRLPNTQIASYIGITPEFLSRIRSQQLRN
jgi:CRP/FNR family transcriptional regulator